MLPLHQHPCGRWFWVLGYLGVDLKDQAYISQTRVQLNFFLIQIKFLFRIVESNQLMTQIIVSKVDSNQLLTQVTLI